MHGCVFIHGCTSWVYFYSRAKLFNLIKNLAPAYGNRNKCALVTIIGLLFLAEAFCASWAALFHAQKNQKEPETLVKILCLFTRHCPDLKYFLTSFWIHRLLKNIERKKKKTQKIFKLCVSNYFPSINTKKNKLKPQWLTCGFRAKSNSHETKKEPAQSCSVQLLLLP